MRSSILLLLVSACAGSSPEAASPTVESGTETGDAPLSKAEQCRLDAQTPRDPKGDAPSKIDVSHILVRHAELPDPRGATRTPQEACLLALNALKALEAGDDWNAVVEKYSDGKDDDLGRVARDDLDPAFANAAFSLDVDEISYVVESERGFHIILRHQ